MSTLEKIPLKEAQRDLRDAIIRVHEDSDYKAFEDALERYTIAVLQAAGVVVKR
jgi:hypothetical protein